MTQHDHTGKNTSLWPADFVGVLDGVFVGVLDLTLEGAGELKEPGRGEGGGSAWEISSVAWHFEEPVGASKVRGSV